MSRASRMGTRALLYSAAVGVALVAVAVLTTRHSARLDVTRGKHQSLSAESKRIVASIPDGGSRVDVIGVTSLSAGVGNPAEAQRQVESVIGLFSKESRRVTTRVVFVESDPLIARALGVDKTPMIVLKWTPPAEMGSDQPALARERRTDILSEQSVAEAMQQLIEGKRLQAYILAGHGGAMKDDRGPAGFAAAAALLSGLNFDSHDLVVAGKATIPEDADLVVVAGAELDLQPDEIDALRGYALRGGRFLVYHGPTQDTGMFPMLQGWLKSQWGVLCTDGVVADLDAPLQENQIALLMPPDPAATHPIVAGATKLVKLPASRKIGADPYAPDGVTVATLYSSGPRSWVETTLTGTGPHYDEGSDLRGPHAVALAATSKPPGQEKEARLVVFGSLAASNFAIGEVGNADLFRNVVSWLEDREADIERRMGSGEDGTVVIAESQGAVILAASLAVPAIVALAGLATWWWRRRL